MQDDSSTSESETDDEDSNDFTTKQSTGYNTIIFEAQNYFVLAILRTLDARDEK